MLDNLQYITCNLNSTISFHIVSYRRKLMLWPLRLNVVFIVNCMRLVLKIAWVPIFICVVTRQSTRQWYLKKLLHVHICNNILLVIFVKLLTQNFLKYIFWEQSHKNKWLKTLSLNSRLTEGYLLLQNSRVLPCKVAGDTGSDLGVFDLIYSEN